VVEMPRIDRGKCNGCGLCVIVCFCTAFVLVDNVVTVIEKEECGWCTECEAVCPTKAISCPFEIVLEQWQD
jgi:MinD superfamily P-loop ATPase